MKKFVKKFKKFLKKKKVVKKVLMAVAVVKFVAEFVDVAEFVMKVWDFIQHCPLINLLLGCKQEKEVFLSPALS